MNNSQFSLLIADDEPLILRGLAGSIPWESINVRVVAKELDGLTALSALETLRPDIAIVDICMPHCDGLTLIERARAQGIDTSFIILSGYEDFAYAQRAIHCGVTAYLLKPINKQELMRTVQEQCGKRLRYGDAARAQNRLQGNRDVLLKKAIADIAAGRLREEREIRERLSALRAPLPYEGACVILISCPQDGQAAAIQALPDTFFNCPYVAFAKEQTYIALAVHVASGMGAMDNLKKLLREYNTALAKAGIAVAAALGTFAKTLQQLPLSLHAARDALQYRFYELPDGVYDAADIDYTPLQEGGVKKIDAAGLVSDILVKNERRIHEQIDAFLQSLFYIAMPPPSFIIGMCSYMMTDVQQRLLPYAKGQVNLPVEELHVQLHAQPSLSALRGWLCGTIVGFADAMLSGGICKHAPIIDQAKAYIHQNLLKKLLLSDVANHVHLSENYLAALFKSYTGQSFRNYLLEKKMEKAKELLLVEHRSIGDVANLLGYEDYRAFTRAFKKQTGISPSALYRHPREEGRKQP